MDLSEVRGIYRMLFIQNAFVNIFSQFLAFLVLLTVPFAKQKFYILIKSSINYFFHESYF